jgi:hypothetical protein
MRLRSSVFAAGFILAAFVAASVLAEEAASVAAPDNLLNRALSIAAHGDLRDLAFTEQTLGRVLKAEPQWIDYQGERVLADLRFEPRDSLVLPKPARFAAYISTGMVPRPFFGHEELARIQFLSLERVFCLGWQTISSAFESKYPPFDMSLMSAYGSTWSFGYVVYQNKAFTIPVMIGMTGKREGCAEYVQLIQLTREVPRARE